MVLAKRSRAPFRDADPAPLPAIAAIRQFGSATTPGRPAPKATPDSGTGSSSRAGKETRVLVVDDNPEHCAYMAEVLTRRGCQVAMTLSGREALHRLTQESFEAVVTDVFMPDLDGIELVRALRAGWPGLRIVAVTGGGFGLAGGVHNYLKYLGVSRILNKPFEPRDLAQAVGDPDRDAAE